MSPPAPCRRPGASYRPRGTPSTSGNRGSERSLRGGTVRRCCLRHANQSARCGSFPPPKTADGWRAGSPSQPALPVPSPAEATIKEAMSPPIRRREGEILVNTGEESGKIYLLEAGWVARTRVIEDGRRQIIVVFLPQDLMGIKCMFLERQPDTIECLTDAHVRTIEHKQLLDLVAQDHAASVRVMFQLGEDERGLHTWVASLGLGTAEERIAHLLLDLRGRLFQAGLANGEGFEMRMTQQEIADHLG